MDPSLKYAMMSELNDSLNGLAQIKGGHVQVTDPVGIRGFILDRLVYNAVFHEDPLIKATSRWLIKEIAQSLYLFPCSTQGIYEAFYKKQKPGFIMPVIRFPGLTFDAACAVFRAGKSLRAGAFVFEISPTESRETGQTPGEFSAVVMAAGIREEYEGPVFLQTGGFQMGGNMNSHESDQEMQELKAAVHEVLRLGFFNLKVTPSDKYRQSPSPPTEYAKPLIGGIIAQSALIRSLEPEGTAVAIEGDFGGLPEKAPGESLKECLDRYRAEIEKLDPPVKGLCKISIPLNGGEQPEPLHPGAPTEKTVEEIRQAARTVRDRYRMAGSVDVGILLPGEEALNLVFNLSTEEIHFSTPFPESFFSHEEVSSEFRERIAMSTIPLGKSPSGSAGQGAPIPLIPHKSFGLYKENFWGLPVSVRNRIGFELEKIYAALFEKFKIPNTHDWIRKVTPEHRIPFGLSHELEAAKNESKALP